MCLPTIWEETGILDSVEEETAFDETKEDWLADILISRYHLQGWSSAKPSTLVGEHQEKGLWKGRLVAPRHWTSTLVIWLLVLHMLEKLTRRSQDALVDVFLQYEIHGFWHDVDVSTVQKKEMNVVIPRSGYRQKKMFKSTPQMI